MATAVPASKAGERSARRIRGRWRKRKDREEYNGIVRIWFQEGRATRRRIGIVPTGAQIVREEMEDKRASDGPQPLSSAKLITNFKTQSYLRER